VAVLLAMDVIVFGVDFLFFRARNSRDYLSQLPLKSQPASPPSFHDKYFTPLPLIVNMRGLQRLGLAMNSWFPELGRCALNELKS
jgi:hypothetical protein